MKHIGNYIDRKGHTSFSGAEFERIDLECSNDVAYTVYKQSPLNSLCLPVERGMQENILSEHGNRETVLHPLGAMIGLKACKAVEKSTKLCGDQKEVCGTDRDDGEHTLVGCAQSYSDRSQTYLSL